MNSTEKKRAELFVTEWNSTHPIQLPEAPIIETPTKWEAAIKKINDEVSALEANIAGQHFDFEKAMYHVYGSREQGPVVRIGGPSGTHPELVAWREETVRIREERLDRIQNLVRRIWNDEVTFQNVLDELEEVSN